MLVSNLASLNSWWLPLICVAEEKVFDLVLHCESPVALMLFLLAVCSGRLYSFFWPFHAQSCPLWLHLLKTPPLSPNPMDPFAVSNMLCKIIAVSLHLKKVSFFLASCNSTVVVFKKSLLLNQRTLAILVHTYHKKKWTRQFKTRDIKMISTNISRSPTPFSWSAFYSGIISFCVLIFVIVSFIHLYCILVLLQTLKIFCCFYQQWPTVACIGTLVLVMNSCHLWSDSRRFLLELYMLLLCRWPPTCNCFCPLWQYWLNRRKPCHCFILVPYIQPPAHFSFLREVGKQALGDSPSL